ncbi:MAG TPA: response regulator [Candidatus Saccharimonadales bacterium]|nr:response regulator [Candidatus Saccharimonadales bacterium]
MKKILLIEDDVFIRDIYARELKKGDYEIVIAADGDEGVAKSTSEKYDLVLLDIMLPKQTGIDVLRKLRQAPEPYRSTPVYLLTNLGQGSIIKQAVDIGAQGYLLKARYLPSQVLESIDRFFVEGPMKINLKEFGLE